MESLSSSSGEEEEVEYTSFSAEEVEKLLLKRFADLNPLESNDQVESDDTLPSISILTPKPTEKLKAVNISVPKPPVSINTNDRKGKSLITTEESMLILGSGGLSPTSLMEVNQNKFTKEEFLCLIEKTESLATRLGILHDMDARNKFFEDGGAEKLIPEILSTSLFMPKTVQRELVGLIPILEFMEFLFQAPRHLYPCEQFQTRGTTGCMLFSKATRSCIGDLYVLGPVREGESNHHTIQADELKNSTLLGSTDDGWVLFLKNRGPTIFYMNVVWHIFQKIPKLPRMFKPKNCQMRFNGWKANVRHYPRDCLNNVVLVGLGYFPEADKETVFVLRMFPNSIAPAWKVLSMPNFHSGHQKNIMDGRISGPVTFFLLKFYVCWVVNGNRLQICTDDEVKEVVIPKFRSGNAPVSIVRKPGCPHYLYLYQHVHTSGPPLLARVKIPSFLIDFYHRSPGDFFMTGYGTGFGHDVDESEGRNRTRPRVIDYGRPDISYPEMNDDEEEEPFEEEETLFPEDGNLEDVSAEAVAIEDSERLHFASSGNHLWQYFTAAGNSYWARTIECKQCVCKFAWFRNYFSGLFPAQTERTTRMPWEIYS